MVHGSSRTRSSRAGWSASAWISTSDDTSSGGPLGPPFPSLQVAAALQGRRPQTDTSVVANCANCGAPMQADRQTGVLACNHCGSTEPLSGIAALIEITGAADSQCPTCKTALARGRL